MWPLIAGSLINFRSHVRMWDIIQNVDIYNHLVDIWYVQYDLMSPENDKLYLQFLDQHNLLYQNMRDNNSLLSLSLPISTWCISFIAQYILTTRFWKMHSCLIYKQFVCKNIRHFFPLASQWNSMLHKNRFQMVQLY